MERAAPVRSSHTSTAGLLAWPQPDGAASQAPRRPNQVTPLFYSPCSILHHLRIPRAARRFWSSLISYCSSVSLQPTEEFRKVVFGGQVTEEADGLNKTKMWDSFRAFTAGFLPPLLWFGIGSQAVLCDRYPHAWSSFCGCFLITVAPSCSHHSRRTTASAPKSKETTGIGMFKAESAAAAVTTASRDRQVHNFGSAFYMWGGSVEHCLAISIDVLHRVLLYVLGIVPFVSHGMSAGSMKNAYRICCIKCQDRYQVS
jgi:hypothetical protein